MRGFFILITIVSLVGCQRTDQPAAGSQTATNAPTAEMEDKALRARGDEMGKQLHVGMLDTDVIKLFGEPHSHMTKMIVDDVTIIWFYKLSPQVEFKIRFDKNNHVMSWETTSGMKIGG